VPLALDELFGCASRPDRFADASEHASRGSLLLDEVRPRRDDPSRIPADRPHVGEPNVSGVIADRVTQQVDLVPTDHNHDRLVVAQRVQNERPGAIDEVLIAPVGQDIVTEDLAGRGQPDLRRTHRWSLPIDGMAHSTETLGAGCSVRGSREEGA
jgi:hypothetical protein